MKHKLLIPRGSLLGALNGENIVGAGIAKQPSLAPASPPDKPITGYVAEAGDMFKIDKENKRVSVWLLGGIYSIRSYMRMCTMLLNLTEDYTVKMFISGPGGSISVGCLIISAMERCKATIITINLGIAASCCSFILAFGKRIRVDPLTITMFHNSAGGGYDSTHRALNRAQHTTASVRHFFEIMKRTGMVTDDEIVRITEKGEEFFFGADEMKRRLIASGYWYEGD